ncbi:helix-turn-helix domain-containing protein [Tepidibacter hydrothermalis]|uniref:Cupin domain-containing protein n=1 Tax=Tepidibacter hydrothermalis TaxID=3036126 RepID=A0ABY8EG36_9FIRM|nr:helix-turn-helix domain-containing protein [Tepidibacter hydrothermalis]WFD11912.1 cupin domain-containing protein [Tepidibacter hydrothermalis]
MNKVEKIKFRNKKKNKGFEIISLKSFFESENTFFIRKHFRTDFYNLIFVTEGKCIHEIDFLEYTIEAGEILIISKNRVHRYSEFDNLEGYLIMFTEGFLCEFLSNDTSEVKDLFKKSYLNPHVNFIDLHALTLTKLLDVIHDMYTNADDVMNYKVIASTFRTFALLIFNIILGEDNSRQKKNEIFIQFTELVEEHIDKEKTVEGYAIMMHVSKKTVNLMTRKAIDMSAKQYIIQQLILKIKLKLCFEQKSINEVANELGFTESSNMTRFFKKYTGINPTKFRSMNRKDNNKWISSNSMDLNFIEESIERRVYHINFESKVPLHAHEDVDEIFYCIKGSGFGVLEDGEVELNVGKTFIAPAGTIHSLRSECDLYVTAFLVPVVDERLKKFKL